MVCASPVSASVVSATAANVLTVAPLRCNERVSLLAGLATAMCKYVSLTETSIHVSYTRSGTGGSGGVSLHPKCRQPNEKNNKTTATRTRIVHPHLKMNS